MKKIITLLGLALSAIVLSNTLFANNLIVDTVSVAQSHIPAYNSIQPITTHTIWYFIFNLENQTATLTYPRTDFNNTNEDFSNGYNFDFVGLEGIWNQNMYNCWSEVIEKKSPSNNNRFYTALRIPDKVDYKGRSYKVTEIGDNSFNGSNINYIDVPESVERIGDYAFANSNIIGQCEASPYQVIPNSVTGLGEGIFKNCKNLKRIDIDANVISIPKYTFDGCTSLSQVRFGKSVQDINCDVDSNVQVAFSSPIKPTMNGEFNASAIWYPKEYKDAYTGGQEYYIEPEKDTYTIYSDQWLKLNFTQKSYFKNPNAVYNYIYYYPTENNGINFSVNALTGRGANKVRFRMLFDDLNAIDQANEVYQIIKQDIATSYSFIKYKYVGEYNVTLRSLDFTRAEANVSINVIPGVSATGIKLTGVSNMVVGKSEQIEHLAVNSKGNTSTVQDVKWSSSNESIATVDDCGIVTALSTGVVTITATSLDPLCPNAKGTLKITVTEPEQDTPAAPQAAAIGIENQIAVTTSGNELTIRSNAPLGKVDIYSIDGKLIKSLNSTLNTETVTLTNSGIYIVKTLTQTAKVKL